MRITIQDSLISLSYKLIDEDLYYLETMVDLSLIMPLNSQNSTCQLQLYMVYEILFMVLCNIEIGYKYKLADLKYYNFYLGNNLFQNQSILFPIFPILSIQNFQVLYHNVQYSSFVKNSKNLTSE